MSYNKETGMYEGYIYCITNKVNGKQYIGQTTQTLDKRWNAHVSECNRTNKNRHLYNAFKYYGIDNFIIEEIFNGSSSDKECLSSFLNYFEILLISRYNTLNPNGYNMTVGGDSFGREERSVKQYSKDGILINIYKSLQEASAFIGTSVSNISNTCLNRQKSSKGYVWRFIDDDFNLYGEYIEYEPSYKVDKYTIDGNFIGTYNSLTLAAQSANAKPINIYKVCCGDRHTSKGYVWRFFGDDFDKYSVRVFIKPIAQYTLDGKEVARYESMNQASIITGISQGSISNVCNGKSKTSKNYMWKYINDYQSA